MKNTTHRISTPLTRRSWLLGAAMTAVMACTATPAFASNDNYPSRPITAIVLYGASSANDVLTRLIAPGLSTQLGQNVAVLNRPGAGGALGTTAIARAAPDGYTIGIGGSASLGVNPQLYNNLAYDSRKDFTPLLRLATAPNVVVVPGDSQIKTLDDLRTALKTGKLRYNSLGHGTTQHLAGALMLSQLNAQADHIPYKSASEAIAAAMSGQVEFGVFALPAVLGQIEAGKLRALGLTLPTTVTQVAGVPVLNDAGFKDLDRTSVWFGMVAPAGLETKTTQRLHDALATTMQDPALRERLAKAGYVLAAPESQASFAQFIADQLEFWKALVASSNTKIEQ